MKIPELLIPAGYWSNPEWLDELGKISNRGYTTGFAFSEEKINETSPDIKHIQTHEPAGTILEYDTTRKMILLDVRNRLTAGDELELILPENTVKIDSGAMLDCNGNRLAAAHGGNKVYFPWKGQAPVGALIRKAIRPKVEEPLD